MFTSVSLGLISGKEKETKTKNPDCLQIKEPPPPLFTNF